MKKIIFAGLASFGFFIAVPVSAVMMVDSNSGSVQTQIAQSNNDTMPCNFKFTSQDGNAMYQNMPCGKFLQAGRMSINDYGHKAQWYELMFILTVIMVWTVLLLLIAVLWKHLKKHKHS